ncbi:B-cell receptor-associated protein 31 isoform X1 [Lucilia sericata]|uniref:B-cell receptor-associated protein 31 isoform X1 n=1 Tax=Lucilia sericata TaxID=13632 RepID=UPI0018A874DB|nr:B-cell receptor-associated protein 31 isoform X1 [Lucilia sericata]
MSFVWTLIDAFLFTEIVIVLLLVLPVASATRWNRFFKSKFLAMLAQQAQIYIFILIGVLVLFLLEAIREMTKFSKQELGEEAQLDMKMQHSMRLFRAQRNFYISGFAIFLVLVIKRLVSLISQQAQLLAQSEASLKQAQSASTAVRNIMSENTKVEKAKEAVEDKNVKEISQLKERIHELTSELNREKKDKEALKSQAESLNKEYDRLTEEFSKLQKKITISGATEGGKGNSKDD